MKNKTKGTIKRKNAIKQLIENYEIGDQQTLLELLRKEYYLEASQAAVSRDLRALGVSKRRHKDSVLYELPSRDASKEILQLAVRDLAHNETTIVVYTLPGLAAFVGDYLDMQSDLEILGTLAGENVVFVIPVRVKHIEKVNKAIQRALHFKQNSKGIL